MLQRASKPELQKKAIEEFKKGADLSPTPEGSEVKIRKITHWIKLDNWKMLKKLSAELSIRTGERVTINMLLDQAIEEFFQHREKQREF